MAAARTCKSCKHPVSASMVRCVYCGADLVKPSQSPTRTCPRCKTAMKASHAQWVMIDRCGTCSGEFYDTGEIDELVVDDAGDRSWLNQNMEARKPDTADGFAMKCPGCSAAMKTFSVPGEPPVVIDVCPKCHGTWLDRGESERLKATAHRRIRPKGSGQAARTTGSRPAIQEVGPIEELPSEPDDHAAAKVRHLVDRIKKLIGL